MVKRALFVATLAISSSCGSNLECGPGALESDGKCVPICSQGTVFDAVANACVADLSVCGHDLVWDDAVKACVPDSKVLCAWGFVWSEADEHCVVRTADVMEAPEPNSLESDGSPAHFTLPEVGATLFLGGNIDPWGADGTSWGFEAVPDIDAFVFEASAGQTIWIRATSAGDPAPAVVVSSTEGEDYAAVYGNYSAWTYADKDAIRFIRFLKTGQYVLNVSDGDWGESLPGQSSGGPGFGYLVGITAVETPADVSLTLGTPLGVDLTAEPAFLALNGLEAGELYFLSLKVPSPAAANPLLFVFDDSEKLIRYLNGIMEFPGGFHSTSIGFVATTSTTRIFLTYSRRYFGSDPVWEVKVAPPPLTDLGTVSPGSPIQRTGEVLVAIEEEPAAYYVMEADCPGGCDLTITGTNVAPPTGLLALALVDSSFQKTLGSGLGSISGSLSGHRRYYLAIQILPHASYTFDLSLTAENLVPP
jgi:hypothetical protein